MSQTGRQRQTGQQGPSDYHAYVFRDGKCVGAFDDMYRYAKGIPWEQDTRCHHWYTEVGMVMLKAHAPYTSILEVGCGLMVLHNRDFPDAGPMLHVLGVKSS